MLLMMCWIGCEQLNYIIIKTNPFIIKEEKQFFVVPDSKSNTY